MPKFKLKWNTDKILGLSAMSVSVLTLAIFIYQTNLLRKQNYITILPYLDLSTTDNSEEHLFEFNIINQGVGPAIIESVKVTYKGGIYDLKDHGDDAFELLTKLNPGFDSIKNYSQSTLDRGMAIPANTKYNVFGVKGYENDYELLTTMLEAMISAGLDYQVVYKSIQDERWSVSHNSEGPIKLD